VQVADANGVVTFTSIYPPCYSGRWPHIHYEVYRSLSGATRGSNAIATSQLAMPDGVNRAVFATSNYNGSTNYSRVSLSTDNVFSDGTTGEVPTVTGSADAGYVVAMNVPVKA
jgi:protocatechuate 3,4-dioxygenase beta subunit